MSLDSKLSSFFTKINIRAFKSNLNFYQKKIFLEFFLNFIFYFSDNKLSPKGVYTGLKNIHFGDSQNGIDRS